MAVPAMVVGILFCPPAIATGIVAIVKASQVESKWFAGDAYGAQESADAARTWSIVSYILGAVGVVIIVLIVIGTVAGSGT
ncbi:MAG: CD225/dispanin family protein [Actinobacteria bacterium]|nr:CD225/dispanin family protein [Actinomycetota bacterium]